MNLVGMQTKKRSRPNKGDGEHLRKKCPQGCSCPFQHEYQHNLEFSHDVQKSPTTVARGWGENERNSRITNINQVYLPTSEGRKLGGTNIFVKPDRSRFLSQFQSKIHSAKSIPSKEAVVYGDLYEVVDLTSIENPSLSTQLNDPDLVQCNSCGAHIPMNLFCQHMESHNFSDATQFNNYNPWDTECGGRYIGDRVLRQRQDEEYEQSILHDIERQSAIDQDERLIRDMEDIRQQQAVVIESQREYIRLKQLEEHQLAKLKLPPEPNDLCGDDLVNIRFTLPSAKKVTRRFRKDSRMCDVFAYLKTLEELIHFKYKLKTTFGNVEFNDKMVDTLQELHITQNTSLVLVTVDITDDLIGEILSGTEVGLSDSPLEPQRKLKKHESSSKFGEMHASFQTLSMPGQRAKGLNNQRKRVRDQIVDLTEL